MLGADKKILENFIHIKNARMNRSPLDVLTLKSVYFSSDILFILSMIKNGKDIDLKGGNMNDSQCRNKLW